jgi:hypothetical protein
MNQPMLTSLFLCQNMLLPTIFVAPFLILRPEQMYTLYDIRVHYLCSSTLKSALPQPDIFVVCVKVFLKIMGHSVSTDIHAVNILKSTEKQAPGFAGLSRYALGEVAS